MKMDFIEEIYKLDGRYDNLENIECSPIHQDLTYRMKKTLYAGDKTEMDSDGIPLPLTDIVVELFQKADQPRISLAQRHVANIIKRAHVTKCSTFLGMVYARRLKQNNPEFITRVTTTELFLVSMMLATKFLYDEGEDEEFFNDEWASVGKLDVKRVHELERDFLDALDWNLFVEPLEFFEFLQAVETRIALNQGSRRGWFSYTDLLVLMNTPEWYQNFLDLIEQSVKVMCVCTVVYGLCAATMVWSGVMLHHAQVPHRPCHGRLPLPFGLQHTKTTRPWQSNPVLDQLLYTFLLRLPVNSDPLGLTYDQSSTWCSLPATLEDDNDVENMVFTSNDSGLNFETGCNCDENCSRVNQQGKGSIRHRDKAKMFDDDSLSDGTSEFNWSDETRGVISKATSVHEALVIFYHALLSALWEIDTVSGDTPLRGLTNLEVNKSETDDKANKTFRPLPKKPCPYRNLKIKSSQFSLNASTYKSQVDSLPDDVTVQCHVANPSCVCRFGLLGTDISGNTGFKLYSSEGHIGIAWHSNNTVQQCISSVKDPH